MAEKQMKQYGLSDSDTVEKIKDLKKEIEDSQKEMNGVIETVNTKTNELLEKMRKENPYKAILEEEKAKSEQLSVDIKQYDDAMKEKLAINRWFQEETQKLAANPMGFDSQQLQDASSSLNVLYAKKAVEAESEVWEQRGDKIGSILSNGFNKALINFDDFGGSMKNMANQLCSYLIQQTMQTVMQSIFGIQQLQGFVSAQKTGGGSSDGGIWGTFGNILGGVIGGLGFFHDGGIVPAGANAALPGTKEQLAVLKGGERVLSPSENTSYEGTQQGSAPVIFNNFSIKAWDSKDVSKYLTENKQLLNQITFDGIKNNNSMLRTMVRNA